MTRHHPGLELAQAEALDVTCPRCEEPPMNGCTYRFYGEPYLIEGFHEERQALADQTVLCPACGSDQAGQADGTYNGLEYTVDACQDCGWIGDPQ